MTSFEEHILTDDLAGGGTNGLSTYGPRVEETDPLWLNHSWSIPQNLFKFKPEVVANDARVSYRSEKYPWLEAAYRYEHETHRPGDFDTAKISLPGRAGPGHYIVHWWWNGYYDCMDVDLFAEPVPEDLKYGIDLGTYAWEKVDHCQYVEPRAILTDCMDATVSAAACRRVIDRLDDPTKAYGINVVPLTNPASVAFPEVVNIPWKNSTCVNNNWTDVPGDDSVSETGRFERIAGAAGLRSCATAGNFEAPVRRQAFSYRVTLDEAIKRCSRDSCVGVAWDSATIATNDRVFVGVHRFFLCSAWDTAPAAGHTGWIKPTNRIAEALAPLTGTPPVDLTVDFHPNSTYARGGAVVVLENDRILRDHGYQFGTRDRSSRQYGWSCSLDQNGRGGDAACPGGYFGIVSATRTENDTIDNTYTSQFSRCPCPDGRRPVWEMAVPNGVYNITTWHNMGEQITSFRAHKCTMEHVQQTQRSGFFDAREARNFTSTVEVADGRFTLSSEHVSQSSCQYMNRIRVQSVSRALLNPVWFPGSESTGAWWQRRLPAAEPIGLVSIAHPSPPRGTYDCGYWWMFKGNKCNLGQVAGRLEDTDEGFQLTVHDRPCSSLGCVGGTVYVVFVPASHNLCCFELRARERADMCRVRSFS